MIFLKALPLLLVLGPVLSADNSLADIEDVSPQRPPPEIEILTHRNCSNITADEMATVLSFYPYVKVKCQAEASTLIPSELRVPENIEHIREPPKFAQALRSKPYTFNEFMLVSERNHTRKRIPISACFRTSGEGRGTYEVSFSLRLILHGMGQVSRALPFYTTSGSLRGTLSADRDANYNVLCAYEANPVRPVAEVSTVITHERVRQWTVEPKKVPFVRVDEWEVLDREQVLEDTLMMACVSEKYEENVCAWNSAEVVERLYLEGLTSVKGVEWE